MKDILYKYISELMTRKIFYIQVQNIYGLSFVLKWQLAIYTSLLYSTP